MRALIIAAILFVPVPAHALEIGARLPTLYGEVIVVKNDGGIQQLDRPIFVTARLSRRS